MTMHECFVVRKDREDDDSGNMNEFNHLADLLEEWGIDYVRKDADPNSRLSFRNQIEVFNPKNKSERIFDVIYNYGTYGYEEGLLEYWDKDLEAKREDPIGHVSAEWVLGYITAKYGKVLGL